MPRLINKITKVVINVDDELAAALDSKWEPADQPAQAEKPDKATEPVVVPEGEPSSEWTVPQLKAHAAAGGVDLGSATKKDDILAVLTAPPA